MNCCNYFMYIAARGQGKTFLTAIFCVVRCILYPGTKISIASGKRKQSIEVLEKITTILMPKSANLRLEVKEYVINQSKAVITFHNDSEIKVVTANDNARGGRANILIVDEFRIVPLDIINKVLRKFLTAPRQPEYLNKPEYKHLKERNKEMYLSSAWFKSHWSYAKAQTYLDNLKDDTKKYFICGLPYQLSIKEDLLDKEQVADEMSESDFSDITWQVEMECLWFGDNDNGLYRYEDIACNRKLKYPIFPESISSKINDKRIRIPTKQLNEKRILSIDLALMPSTKNHNDASSIFINQLIPRQTKYINNIIYTDNYEGERTEKQALRVRKLYAEYDCDYIVIDAKGVGFGVVDALLTEQYDPSTGEIYPALSCKNDDTLAARCTSPDAPKVIWAVNGSPQFNSDCALLLREVFKQGRIRLPVAERDAVEDFLPDLTGYNRLSVEDKHELSMPYRHTSLLIHELINLDYEAKDRVIKVRERPGARKDRYSSLSYNIYMSKLLERDLSKPKNNNINSNMFVIRKPVRAENRVRW